MLTVGANTGALKRIEDDRHRIKGVTAAGTGAARLKCGQQLLKRLRRTTGSAAAGTRASAASGTAGR